MELILTDEQKLLQASAATLVGRSAGPDRVRTRRDAGGALDRATWAEVAEAGWLSILVPEEAGGLGLGMTDLALVLDQAGRSLLQAPVCAAAVAARAAAEGESAALRDELAGAIASGGRVVIPALSESATDPDSSAIKTAAAADGDAVRLTGVKRAVADAADADGFLVSASGPHGALLCHLPADSAGVRVAARRTVDGAATADIEIDNASVAPDQIVAGPNRAPALIATMRDSMLVGLGAELVGVMGQALDIALEYLKVRHQFDRPIGSFQALQHRAVDDYAAVELTRSLLFQVCAAIDEDRASAEMASVLKAKASSAALKVTKSAIQMHGGIGFTDEHDIGLYLKRAMALSAQYGNAAVQRRRYAELAGVGAAR